MPIPIRLRFLVPLALAGLVGPVFAAPADQIRTRINGYRDLGEAFKAINDGLRSPSPQRASLQAAVRRLRNAAAQQYKWFPAKSGAQSGIKTAAKPEIWTQAARFRQSQNAFAAQAAAFERVVSSGDVAAMRKAARSLGATCKGCHDQFRFEPE